MIKRIKIQGLGPHLDFRAEFDPRGPNTVTGPSEVGKTFLIESVLFCLFGRSQAGRFRPEAIHDGQTKAIVEVTLDSGRTLRRSITRGKSVSRQIEVAGEETSFASEDAFAAALGDLGRDPEVVELLLAPLGWVGPSAGNARALRDLLARILPAGDVAGEVRSLVQAGGHACTDDEAALSEAQVSARRRDVRKERDQAEGRAALAEERLRAITGSAPPADTGTADPVLLERIAAWAAYDRADSAARERASAEAAGLAWDQRRLALGDEPDAPAATAATALAPARTALQGALAAGQQAGGQVQMLTMQRQMFVAGPDVCPTCQRPGWAQGATFAAQLDSQLEGAQASFAAATEAARVAQAEIANAEAGEARAREATLRREAWRSGSRALGPRPEAPPPPDAVAPPVSSRPSPEEAAAGRAAQERAVAARDHGERWLQQVTEAEASVARERTAFATAESEATRLDALLEAARAAPSVVAARQAQALGDLGPVRLEFGDNPAVTVLVDERPWWLASRGRQVVADAWLRAALRRAVQMPWLPLFVDNVQDVGGQPLPELQGPVVFLQTTDHKGISVRRRVPRETSTSES